MKNDQDQIKKQTVEYIKINKIHGFRNFHIDLNEKTKILVSENGQGKTTVLKTIDALLSANPEKLKNINFESAEVKFKNSEAIHIRKDELQTDYESRSFKYLEQKTPSEILKKTIEITEKEKESKEARVKIRRLMVENNIQIPFLVIKEFTEEKESWITEVKKKDFFTKMQEYSIYDSLYLPTYRRIEDELSTLSTHNGVALKDEIQFGLGDVERKIAAMKSATLTTANDSMARINGEILTRLVNGLSVNEEDKAIITDNSHNIELVLKHVGHTLSETDKKRIVEMIQSERIFENKSNDALIYFLSKMCKAFLDQRKSDEALAQFANKCTSYFVNKTMEYDERELSIKIFENVKGKEIKLNQLSSGEKQIVSIFSKMHLNPDCTYAVLFDEPELSLSVEWQKKVIHDVISSNSCGLLIAMTHSPFIFSGLSNYTSNLIDYFTEEN